MYKRQLSFFATQIIACIVILLGAFFVNFMAVQQEITSKTNFLPSFFYILLAFSATAKNSLEPIPVSYTHLDVYKRQFQYRRGKGSEAFPEFDTEV